MNTDKKVPKVKSRVLSALTPNSELKTPNFLRPQVNAEKPMKCHITWPRIKDFLFRF